MVNNAESPALVNKFMPPDSVAQAMLEGLIVAIKANLRQRLLAELEPALNQAIEAAVQNLGITVNSYFDQDYVMLDNKAVVEVILRDLRPTSAVPLATKS